MEDKVGISASGSPMMLRMMRNLLGSSARMGRVLSATDLYFFLGRAKIGTKSSQFGVVAGCGELEKEKEEAEGGNTETGGKSQAERYILVRMELYVAALEVGEKSEIEEVKEERRGVSEGEPAQSEESEGDDT
jgi:hypothetical protein